MNQETEKLFEEARKTSYLFESDLRKYNRTTKFSYKKRKLYEIVVLVTTSKKQLVLKRSWRTGAVIPRYIYSSDDVFKSDYRPCAPRVLIGKRNIKRATHSRGL